MSAFGVIVAGRMVQTQFTTIKENEFAIELPNAESINHIVVFLTGLNQLPPDYGGSIYISWPNQLSNDGQQWHYVSFISNEKPSALFKIGQLQKSTQLISSQQSLFNNFGQTPSQSAILGIILEPLAEIQQRIETEKAAAPSEQASIGQFAEKMLRNFVNFMQSFVVVMPKPGTLTGQTEEYVPAKAINDWFNNFQRRLQIDPNFWKGLP